MRVEGFTSEGGYFLGADPLDPSQGETTATQDYMFPKCGWQQRAGQVLAVVRLWPPPEDRGFL